MAAPMMKMVLQCSGMHREYPLNDFEDALIYIGTTPNCQILLDRAAFQSDFEFLLKREQNEWTLCDGPGAHCWQARHLEAIPVLLGTDVSVRYANRIDEICRIRFLQTARDSWQDFDLRIPLMAEAQRTVYISGTRGGNIWLKDPEAAQEAVELQAVGGSWRLNVPRSLCGVYLNGELVTQPVLLKDMDFFTVYNYTFYYKGSALYTASRLQNDITGLHTQDVSGHTSALQYPVFLRSTRVQYVVNDNEIEVLPPKGMQEEAEDNLWLTLVPALVMLVVVVVLRGFLGGGGTFVIYSVASMVVAMGVSIATRRSKRKQYLKREEQRKARYLSYIQTKVEEIKRRRQEEIVIWNRIYRPMYDNLTTVRNFDKGLFDRSFEDQDFLDVRIGTGQMEAMARIKVSRQEYKETDDDLVDLPLDIEAKYRRLENAPVVAHFRQANGIGVVGKRDRQYELLKIMTMDLCLRHYYKALRLFFIFPQEEKEKFAWARWLHNCRNEDTSLRNLMYDDESIKIHLEQLYRILSTREEEYTEDASGPPVWPCYYVIFAYDCEPIRNHPVSQYFESCSRYGVTFVFFNEHEECIPRGCREIVYVNALDLEGRLIECKNGDLEAPYILTPLENALVDEIVQKLCPVEVVESSLENDMTKNISLFQLLGVEKVEDFDFTKLWAASKVEKSMGVPLGVRTKNDIVYLDLHEKYHGPHGLVAGTTGSGKSEILQSYILSMAVHFHPHEVGFLIIDFKGGGMVNQFRDLPHLLGAITNMEGREVERSLKSIKAELLRRQSLFADADVNHIDAYILAHKKDPARVPVPLPHLIMIVDEFAELKSEHGDFMKELISAARIGRSLGVHLILATQKPSGVVDDQIWSNSKFKLCLKVQTREDSNEVLKTPLAAEIREPGRAYLQVGNNEILELFQSAYSGAKIHRDKDARAKFSISELNLWGKGKTVYRTVENKSDQGEQITELQALVDAINEHCRQAGIHRLATICMEPLADELLLSDIAVQKPADPQRVYAAVGIYDDPERMTQAPLLVDVTESNLFLLGSSQTGKTVFVQTMVASLARLYTPRDVNIYIIDGGNSIPKTFEQSGIIGGICYREEEERMGNLLNMLSNEFENRRRKFVQASVGNYRSYLASGYNDLPHILVILDNAVAFKEFCTEIYEELIAMSREGLGLGVYFIVTSTQYSVLSPKIMIGFGTRLALNCNDTSEYSNLFDRCRMEPKNTPGRGLVQMEKRILEFQTAWSANGKNEQERNENIVAAFLKRNQSYGGMAARPIPMVPDILPANEFYASFKPKTPYAIPVGISYNTVEPVLLPLLEYSMLPVIGRSRSGRTNFIRQVLGAIQRTTLLNRTRCYIIDSMQQPLESCSKNYGFVAGYTVNAQDAPGILQEVVQELEKRQQYLVENRQKGREEDLLKDLPLLLVVAENPDFIAEMSRDKETVQLINAFLKLNRYKALILINNVENVSFTGMSSPELGKRLRDAKQAILMEDLANWRIFDASPKLLRQYPKPLRQGDAYLYSQGVVTDKIRTIFMNE